VTALRNQLCGIMEHLYSITVNGNIQRILERLSFENNFVYFLLICLIHRIQYMLTHTENVKRRKAESILLLTTFIWGGTFVVVKGALGDASPLAFLGVRFVIAGIILLPFVFWDLMKSSANVWYAGFLLGVMLFIGFATQTIGLNFTTASKSGFITGLLVVFTPLLQLLIEKRVPRPGNLLGVVLVLIGLFLLTSPRGSEFNIGDALTLACAFFFALYIVYLDIYSKLYSIGILTFIQIFTVAVLSLAGAFIFEEIKLDFTNNLIFALAYTAILATLLTTYLQTRYQRDTTPTRAAIIFALEPLFSAVLAYFILAELLGTIGIIGGAILIIGLITSELSDVLEKWGFRFKIDQ
jgi:drug/metabolite transporter (DMT)-like permease